MILCACSFSAAGLLCAADMHADKLLNNHLLLLGILVKVCARAQDNILCCKIIKLGGGGGCMQSRVQKVRTLESI